MKTLLRRVLAVSVIWFFGITTRKVRINWHIIEKLMAEKRPFLLGSWHNNGLMGVYDMRRYRKRISLSVSRSKDGDDSDWVQKRFGYGTARGSTSTGATGLLREILRKLSNGEVVVVTPDGPRGPRYVLQGGIVALARKKKVPIVPMSAPRRWEFSSWDRLRLPKPFSRIYVCVGTPIYIDPEAEDESERRRVERIMRDQVRVAEAYSGAAARYPDPVLEEEAAQDRSGAVQEDGDGGGQA